MERKGHAGSRIGRLAGALGVLIAIAVPSPAGAGDSPLTIPPGIDLFETDPQTTQFTFTDNPPPAGTQIPADFFGPGSEPFVGSVYFAGEPFGTFVNGTQTFQTGDADTVVRRTAALEFNGPVPQQDEVPIQMVALNLVSMQPITVTYEGGSTELWQVNAAISQTPPQPQGQMNAERTGIGGTFSSQLPVLPRLTFTRLSDGTTAVLDLVNIIQPPQYPAFTFQANNVPWRQGCALPALAITGLNETFCPGLTITPPVPQKALTVEQAAFASHGVYPVQPGLEHFKCYKLEPKPFQARTAQVDDQFGPHTTDIPSRSELCNPAQKKQELFVNNRVHLQCYKASGPDNGNDVFVRNQFGSQRLDVGVPQQLCLPSQKRTNNQPFPAVNAMERDHFFCYRVTEDEPLRSVNGLPGKIRVTDQFGVEKLELIKPFRLCAPAEKNNELAVQHRVQHLVCYKARGKAVKNPFEIKNQYEQKKLKTARPSALCVPSAKFVLP